jgi:putative Holliday junction resolvase
MLMKKTRFLSIDYGLARIGIAYSDETKLIAMPLQVMKVEKKSQTTADQVIKVIKEHQEKMCYEIEAIIVGKPFLMSGKSGIMADEVDHFIALLSQRLNCPVIPWDERLSSVQADRALREAEFTRKKRAKHVDTVSAVIILQNYLDHLHFKQNREEGQSFFGY